MLAATISATVRPVLTMASERIPGILIDPL
jgi:hypothetical protein